MRLLTYSLMLTLLASCAQVVAPTGGDKDQTPPAIIASDPPDLSTNFDRKRIEITFDEYIQFNNLKKQLIISPPLLEDPDISIKKKSVVIEFKPRIIPKANGEPGILRYFEDNTTYTINFGNAIADITENNKADNLTYTFSTGDYVDSLWIAGRVLNARTKLPEPGVLVMLYTDYHDSIPYQEKPQYVAKTDANGEYLIRHIKEAEYKVFALKDANQNYRYDDPSELIGFIEDKINPRFDDRMDMLVFQEFQPITILSHEVSPQRISVLYSRYDERISMRPDGSELATWSGDTVHHWFTFDEPTEWMITPYYFDPGGSSKMFESLGGTVETGPGPELIFSSSGYYDPVTYESGYVILFSHPIKALADDTLLLEIISEDTSTRVIVDPSRLGIYVNSDRLSAGSSYDIVIPEGTFLDVYGNENPTDTLRIRLKKESEFGEIKLSIGLPGSKVNYNMELVNSAGDVVVDFFLSETTNLMWKFIPPGKYSLRVYEDANNNAHWDTGDYLNGRQPEPIYYINREINIRANWEFEIDWTLED